MMKLNLNNDKSKTFYGQCKNKLSKNFDNIAEGV